MQELPEGFPCDDGFDCTSGEGCTKGRCKPSKSACQCTTTAECTKYAATDKCVGSMFCNKPEGQCYPNPATVVTCGVGKDTDCLKNTCDAKDGVCKMTPASEGKPCEADGNWCTTVDVCKGGTCAPATNLCPCASDADCKAKQSADLCAGTLYCDKAKKVCAVAPGTAVGCAGGTTCSPQQCDPKDSKCKATQRPDGTPCNDGGFVCSKDTCAAGECVQQSNACLCWEDSDCAPFDDANVCNGSLYGDKTAGPPSCRLNAATVVPCPAALPGACTVSLCDPTPGQCNAAPANKGGACDDADPCTTGDTCAGGSCAGLPVPVTLCDDADVCTTDACTAKKGCAHAPA